MSLILAQRDDELDKQKHENRIVKKQRGRALERCSILVARTQDFKRKYTELVEQTSFKPGRYTSVFGAYAIAIGRALPHTSSTAAALMMSDGEVKDKNTVNLYEHRVALAKAIVAHDFYNDQIEIRQRADIKFSVAAHSLGFDGAQSEIVSKEKTHVWEKGKVTCMHGGVILLL